MCSFLEQNTNTQIVSCFITSIAHIYARVCTQLLQPIAQSLKGVPVPFLGLHFRMLFQSSKLKARTSLFTETWQKRRSSFELRAFENVTPSGISAISPISGQQNKATHPKWDWLYCCTWKWSCNRDSLLDPFDTEIFRCTISAFLKIGTIGISGSGLSCDCTKKWFC